MSVKTLLWEMSNNLGVSGEKKGGNGAEVGGGTAKKKNPKAKETQGLGFLI